MIGATLFSGIGAPETAMSGWEWPWHAENERFPSAVLDVRHPKSANLGDVTADGFTTRARSVARPDVLVFGSPCQSFSVAGRRLGLDDPRGNLALVALGIVARLEPRWFVFENVPGLLSSAEGRDFGLFLRAVDELGCSLAWAVLDAQHFGVAQRRERIFAVGYLGDWRGPAAVLFEPEGLRGDSPPRHQARQDVAGSLGAGSKRSGQRVGRREAANNHLLGFNNTGQGWWNDAETAQSVRKGDDSGGGGARESTLIAHALHADFDASEDGTGRGTPIIPVAFGGNDTRGPIEVSTALNAHGGPKGRMDFESETFIAFDTTQITSKENRCQPRAGEPCHPLAAGAHPPAIAFDCKAGGNTGFSIGDIPGSLRGEGHGSGHSAVAYDLRNASQADVTQTLQSAGLGTERGGNPNAIPHVMNGAAVRRLTPRECERLQGYPDDYTLIAYRGKPAADGPRYKALGNSMAVPVMRWILTRVEQVDALMRGRS